MSKKVLSLLAALSLVLCMTTFFGSCNRRGEEESSSSSRPETSSQRGEVSSKEEESSKRENESSSSLLGELESDLSGAVSDLMPEPSSGETSSVSTEGVSPDQDAMQQAQGELSSLVAGLSTQKVTWGPGRGKDGNPPPACVSLQQQYGDQGAFFLQNTKEKTIYLTFDEGYEYGLTDDILDTLKAKEVKAVFFVTMDFVNQNKDLVRRMIDEGHIVGNHSTNHPSMPSLSAEKQAKEIQTLHDKVKTEFGYEMSLFRYPMGEFSEASLAVLRNCGYKAVFWSFAYRDWVTDDQPDKEASLQLLCDQLHSGAIYLLHAVSRTNSDILGDFIDRARNEGYTFGAFPVS